MAFTQGPALPPVPKGYSALLLVPTWGPQMSIQRLTLQVATAVTTGVQDIGHPSIPDLASRYCFLALGQPLAPSGELPWPLMRPPHVGLPSSWT